MCLEEDTLRQLWGGLKGRIEHFTDLVEAPSSLFVTSQKANFTSARCSTERRSKKNMEWMDLSGESELARQKSSLPENTDEVILFAQYQIIWKERLKAYSTVNILSVST